MPLERSTPPVKNIPAWSLVKKDHLLTNDNLFFTQNKFGIERINVVIIMRKPSLWNILCGIIDYNVEKGNYKNKTIRCALYAAPMMGWYLLSPPSWLLIVAKINSRARFSGQRGLCHDFGSQRLLKKCFLASLSRGFYHIKAIWANLLQIHVIQWDILNFVTCI